jgi:GxxExxY protein
MAITVKADLVRMTQREFGTLAYEVMHEIFLLHNELGSLFDEKVYKNALAARIGNLQTEVQINVTFRDFRKSYFMDAVVSNGAAFELKAVDALNARHRSQLLHYLLLTGLEHGKLVNFRTEHVEHEFVNTTLTRSERTNFDVRDDQWNASDGFGEIEKNLILEVLEDWGTGLDRALYEEVLIHLLGGKLKTSARIGVCHCGTTVARQSVPLCGEETAIRLTTFQHDDQRFSRDLSRFLNATRLKAIQWINIAHREITFKTLHNSTSIKT